MRPIATAVPTPFASQDSPEGLCGQGVWCTLHSLGTPGPTTTGYDLSMWTRQGREKLWSQLNEPWDLVIVGGGITGGANPGAANTLYHHIYPNCFTNSLYLWINFGAGGSGANQRNFCINGFTNRISSTWRRHIDHARIAACGFARFDHCVKNRQAQMG